MAFDFDNYVRTLPGRGQGIAYGADPSLLPEYYDEMSLAGTIGGVGQMSLPMLYPAVMNNLDYAPQFIDYAKGVENYNKNLSGVNNYLTATNFLGPQGASYFDYASRPGTSASIVADQYLNTIPYVGLGRGINYLTSNEANPYGAIPVFNSLQKGINSVVTGMNNSPVGRWMGDRGADLYNATIGNLYDMNTGAFRGASQVASVPGAVIASGGDAVGQFGSFLREGYQALDRNVFGNSLPGGADINDAASMQYDSPWKNPFGALKKAISGIPGSFKSKTTAEYENLSEWSQGLVDQFESKHGMSRREALNAISAPVATFDDDYNITGYEIQSLENPQEMIARQMEEFGYTDDQMKRVGVMLAEASEDPTQNPFLDLDEHMKETFGTNIEFDDDYFIKIGPDAQAGEMKDAYLELQQGIGEKYGNESAKDLLGSNAISDDVLNIINSDLDPDMSVAEAESWSSIRGEYDPIAVELTDKEKYNIGLQNEFDKNEYKDHLKYLDDGAMSDTSERITTLSSKGKDMTSDEVAELQGLMDKQDGYKGQVTDSDLKNQLNESSASGAEGLKVKEAEVARLAEIARKEEEAERARVEEKLRKEKLSQAQINNAMRNFNSSSTFDSFLRNFDYTPYRQTYNYNTATSSINLGGDYTYNSLFKPKQEFTYDRRSANRGFFDYHSMTGQPQPSPMTQGQNSGMAIQDNSLTQGTPPTQQQVSANKTAQSQQAQLAQQRAEISANNASRVMDNMSRAEIAVYRPKTIQLPTYTSTYIPSNDTYSIRY